MDWQTPEDAAPSAFVTESQRRKVAGKPPASGAWRVGDDPGHRRFATIGDLALERGGGIPNVSIARIPAGFSSSARGARNGFGTFLLMPSVQTDDVVGFATRWRWKR